MASVWGILIFCFCFGVFNFVFFFGFCAFFTARNHHEKEKEKKRAKDRSERSEKRQNLNEESDLPSSHANKTCANAPISLNLLFERTSCVCSLWGKSNGGKRQLFMAPRNTSKRKKETEERTNCSRTTALSPFLHSSLVRQVVFVFCAFLEDRDISVGRWQISRQQNEQKTKTRKKSKGQGKDT